MNYKKLLKNSLSDYIDELQSQGRYFFSKQEAILALGCKEQTFDRAAGRLEQKKRVVIIKPGFLTIVPLEYKNSGSLPADWFINDLMSFLERPYYVGLLSAAALYGAAHQQPQQFQVITDKQLRRINKGKTNIAFFKKQQLIETPTRNIQTPTGHMKVSTPEATALDLIKFYKVSGYFSHIATVLSELIDTMDKKILAETARDAYYDWPVIQRLGYLLSHQDVGGSQVAQGLLELVRQHKPRYIPLASYKKYNIDRKDDDWRVFTNEWIEVDV